MKYKGVSGKGRNLDREKYGVKGNGEKPSQVIAGTIGNTEGTNGKGENGKIASNDLLPSPAVNATKLKPRAKLGN